LSKDLCPAILAYSVILRDQAIDDKEQEIDRLCLEYLVRQQPAAGHLRLIYATMKINPNLERIGDYAESIAKQSLVINSLNLDIDFSDFKALADIAIPMVNESVKAFIERNESLAWATIEREELANEIRDLINVKLYEMREKGKIPLEALSPLMTVARRLERVSDQAKNICEEALYNATGKYMKHQSNEVFRVLFVDLNNSHLSQMAEGIASSMGLNNFVFSSAGLNPQAVNLATAKAMADKNCSISSAIAKSVEQIPNFEHYHVIVALDPEAKRVFPGGPTKTIGVEWPTTDLGKDDSFEEAFEFITQQITDLTQAILGQSKYNE
jgi:phosphate transport system protein